MNPDIKKSWIDALQSGEFGQVEGTLLRCEPGEKDKMCCLGVLSELHARETGAVERAQDEDGDWGYRNTVGPDDRFIAHGMPHRVTTQWAGLDPSDEVFLANLNDEGTPFPAIAVYIERHL